MAGLHDIAQERAAALAALQSAEDAMKSGAGDPRTFAKAKAARQEAADALERLDWAERAERDRQAADAKQAKVDRLREVVDAATEAHRLTQDLQPRLAQAAADLVALVKQLQDAQERVTVAVNHEGFAQREGMIPRVTVPARLGMDREAAVTALRAAQELCVLCGMSRASADQQATQRRL